MATYGSARISENGTVRGQRGDQNSREVSTQPAYMLKNSRIIRAKDDNVANGLAFTMLCACNFDKVGYSQPDRYAVFFQGIDSVPTNADCSSLVAYCVRNCGITNFEVTDFYTGNMEERLLGTGQFNAFPCTNLDTLETGDIVYNANHTVIVTEGIPRDGQATFDEPQPTLRRGDSGAEVLKLQKFANQYCNAKLLEDSDFGKKTEDFVKFMQGFWGLVIDGVYGEQSHKVVLFILWANGVKAV